MKTCSKCNTQKELDQFNKNMAWCKCCTKEYNRQYYKNNKKYHNEKNKKWSLKNKEYNNQRNKDWMDKNKEQRASYKKIYRQENQKSIKSYKRERERTLRKDPKYRLEKNLRRRLWRTTKKITNGPLENKSCTQASKDLLGCSIDELQSYLESKFTDGMTWDNYGKWHIDHIIPVCSFDLTNESQVKECFHHSNLQPLWAIDNILKGSKTPI